MFVVSVLDRSKNSMNKLAIIAAKTSLRIVNPYFGRRKPRLHATRRPKEFL
jgi:hypothetical protein